MKMKIEAITTREHYEKYSAILMKKSLYYLKSVVEQIADRATLERVFLEGDTHLNTIALVKWDMAARQYVGATPWQENKSYASLAEQVCLLKHVAIYHVINATPKF